MDEIFYPTCECCRHSLYSQERYVSYSREEELGKIKFLEKTSKCTVTYLLCTLPSFKYLFNARDESKPG